MKKLRNYLEEQHILSKVSSLKKSSEGLTVNLALSTPRNLSLEDVGQMISDTDIDLSWEMGL